MYVLFWPLIPATSDLQIIACVLQIPFNARYIGDCRFEYLLLFLNY